MESQNERHCRLNTGFSLGASTQPERHRENKHKEEKYVKERPQRGDA
jgi:5,10-methylenetetrahydrofolate reductase